MSTNLPPTAYVKMIDCWLIFSLTKPFVDIILQTYIQTLRDNKTNKCWMEGGALPDLENWGLEMQMGLPGLGQMLRT